MKLVRSALRTGRLYTPGNIPGTYLCYRLRRLQGHSAAGRVVSLKNSHDTIGYRTRDLSACSAMPQLRYRVLPRLTTEAYKSNALR